jgi:DNA-binding winged helix-turn-helix (wHTH) protein/tetratricopeptide (TPR) repeat protein
MTRSCSTKPTKRKERHDESGHENANGYNRTRVSAERYRFGPFVADRARYQVERGGVAVDLTPKLLDLLFHLLDHAGTLVTKEALLDALWPDANVTDNALAQAVSELRQALGDDAASPRFIRTVARRGYRFVATVAEIQTSAEPPPSTNEPDRPTVGTPAQPRLQTAIVMDFANVTGDADCAWLSAGIAETVTGDLRALDRFRVVERAQVVEASRRVGGSAHAVAAALDAAIAVIGSYQRNGERVRITARVVDVQRGDALADAKVDGPIEQIFELQDQVVSQFARELGIADQTAARPGGARETPSLEAYRAFTEAWLHLETLDTREIPQAIGKFQHAIAVDPRYALAFTGLASAELAAYEETRSDNAPARALLQSAIDHARAAVALDDALAEAHATLAFVLVSAWDTANALASARRAVALEPANWRHCFRLGHAAWGNERLRAAANTLALYPDFAFAHFQSAMVHVARGHLREAETVLRQGAAVQDRQVGRGDRYPALGLHWLLALVRLAQDDVGEALQELDRERELATPHRLYGREYRMHAWSARGACLLRIGRFDEAIESFRQALVLSPDHAPTHLGLSAALDASGARDAAEHSLARADDAVRALSAARPIEAGFSEGQRLALTGRMAEAAAALCQALDRAPAGFAGWTLPVEPLLKQMIDKKGFTPVAARLSDRAG